MRHASLALLAVLALPAIASCDRAPTAAQREEPTVAIRRGGTANSSARRALRYPFGATTAELSFLVSNNGSSVTTGKALYYSSAAGVVMAINVTCLHVSGGTATFLGTIIESNSTSLEGKDAYWRVVDAATDQASLINIADAGTGPNCTVNSEFDLVNVSASILSVS